MLGFWLRHNKVLLSFWKSTLTGIVFFSQLAFRHFHVCQSRILGCQVDELSSGSDTKQSTTHFAAKQKQRTKQTTKSSKHEENEKNREFCKQFQSCKREQGSIARLPRVAEKVHFSLVCLSALKSRLEKSGPQPEMTTHLCGWNQWKAQTRKCWPRKSPPNRGKTHSPKRPKKKTIWPKKSSPGWFFFRLVNIFSGRWRFFGDGKMLLFGTVKKLFGPVKIWFRAGHLAFRAGKTVKTQQSFFWDCTVAFWAGWVAADKVVFLAGPSE